MERVDYGYFDKQGREYVVTEVNTPLPFVNYFWNRQIISGVSQHLAGIGCFTERPMQYMDPHCRCLMVRDENRHFYLRDADTAKVWSPGWYPVLEKLDRFSCRHGLGYSTLESEKDQIETRMRVFVPSTDPVELWTVTLRNKGANPRKVQFYSFADWLLKGYQEYCDYFSSLTGAYNQEKNLLVSFNGAPERPHNFFNAFVASDLKPTGFDSSRKAFLGMSQVNCPQAVMEGRCRNSLAAAEKLCGALEHTFELKPGQETTFNVMFGATDTMELAESFCDRWFQPGKIDEEFQAVTENLVKSYTSVFIETPEEKLNSLFNYWIKRSVQLHTEVGTDTGKGLRDVLQAVWAVAGYDPEGAKRKIIESLKHQYSDGHTLRGWDPVDDHHYSDGPVWIAPALDSYLRETGDLRLLHEKVPYFDKGEATVWEHTLTAIRHSTDDLGSHRLIKAHFGDWNDSLNWIGIGEKGETVWTSIAMVYSMSKAMDIAREVFHDNSLVHELKDRSERLKRTINEQGWDGQWYLEGINDAGEKVGSHTEKEGRVYLNPQTWAIMAGVAEGERLKSILKVIDNDLECDYGSLVMTPAYRHKNPGIGRLTTFIPGMWENSSPYCHGTSFKIFADISIKRANEAYRSMKKILPDSEVNPSSHSGCPPYMVTNMYYGPEHPRKGEILYSWITGTADWLYNTMTSYMIGVRASYNGLLIDPCVPSHWDKFSLKRAFRGCQYEVEFANPNKKQFGVTSIEVDGKKITGNLLPLFTDNKTHSVKVVM